MNRDTFPGMRSHARAEVARPSGNNSLRSIRSRTRRRLHEPRPPATPEVRTRIGQWKAEVKAACLAGYIGKGDDKYALDLLAIPSIARGDYGLYSDAAMGRRLNVSGRTIRRHRKALADQGLIEVLGYGKDRKPCAVRPTLRDGSPVFLDQRLAGRSDTNGRLTRPVVDANLLLTDPLETEFPPLPPATEPDVPEGGAVDRVEDEEPTQLAEAASPAETAQAAQQAPTEPPGPSEVSTQPPGTGGASARSTAVPPATQPSAEAAKPIMTFPEFWLAMRCTGSEGYARTQWGKLSATNKAAIQDRLRRPRSWAADMWAGKWLECRVWEEPMAVPTTTASRPERVWLHERTAEWRCWQKHLVATRGRGTPVDNRGGWHFPSKLPPLKEEARR